MLLHRNPNNPKMVYLDQFLWINLSLAYHQRPGGKRFAAALEDVQEAVDQNIARFPFSDSHVEETMKHGNLERRQRLAQVMAEVSEGWSIAPLHNVTPQELIPELSKAFNKPVTLTSPVVFGQGIEFAFGAPPRIPLILKFLNSPEKGTTPLRYCWRISFPGSFSTHITAHIVLENRIRQQYH